MADAPAGGPSGLGRVDLMLRCDCNISCPFCYQDLFEALQPRFDFGRERIDAALGEGQRHGYDELYISGGEPTMGESLPDIMATARDMGYRQIKIMTNGLRLASASYTDELVACGLTGVAFSLHGHEARVHELHTAREGSFDRLMRGLRHLVREHAGAVDVEVNTVVTRHNLGSLGELARFVAGEGVPELHLQHVVPSSPGAREMMPDPERMRAALRRVIETCPDGLHISMAFVPYCWLPGLERYIPRFDFTTPFLSNCPEMFDGWREALLEAKEVRSECEGCPDFNHCRGFWKTG